MLNILDTPCNFQKILKPIKRNLSCIHSLSQDYEKNISAVKGDQELLFQAILCQVIYVKDLRLIFANVIYAVLDYNFE